VHQLDAVEVEEATQEVARRDVETSLDVREEDNGLADPLIWELLARRQPPADLRLGPQQPAIRELLDLLLHHRGRLPDGARIWDGSLLHLALFKDRALGSRSHERLGSHARSRWWQT
jgi:hypothetical protein